jgi:DNA-binding transcriptional regulator YdaS (Cro superfamily)
MASQLTPFEAFELAVSRATGQSAFARVVGCTPGNISQLIRKRAVLPGRFVLAAEREFGVSRHLLRPDLYPHDAASPAPSPMGGVVTPAAPIVACDRSGILHSDAARG